MPSAKVATRASFAVRLGLASALTLNGVACRSRSTESKPAASATASAQLAPQQADKHAAAQPGRRVELRLSGDSLDEAWKDVEASLTEATDPVDTLDIDARGAPFGDEGVRRLLERWPQLAPRQLTLSNTQITPAGLKTLLASTLPARLELLDLRDNLLGPAGARLLAETIRLGSLRELNLGRNHIHASGASALSRAHGLTSLARLELEYNFIGSEGARALAESTTLAGLQDLGLAYNFLGDEGARQLARKSWPKLALLDVGGNEIGSVGATALGTATTLAPGAAIWFGSNLEDQELKRLGLEQRFVVDGSPARDDRTTLGELDAFARPKRGDELTVAAPPEDLPSRIQFRELWIWEFGLVAEFPTFMLPSRPPGNGKSRTFSWLDQATLAIGGYWLSPDQTKAEALKSWTRAEPGERVQVEHRQAQTLIVRHLGGRQTRVVRVQSAYGALFYVDFAYPAGLDSYFAPIAARAIDSLYFDRAHLKP